MRAVVRHDVSTDRVLDSNAVVREAILACAPDLLQCCRDPWTLIGSAAARLSGADVTVADLDILTSRRDAEALAGRWRSRLDAAHSPADGNRFRSRFARFIFPALPLEIMGGLELFNGRRWLPVEIRQAVTVDVGGLAIPIPAVPEQIRILKSFGRPKDLQRAALLKPLARGPA